MKDLLAPPTPPHDSPLSEDSCLKPLSNLEVAIANTSPATMLLFMIAMEKVERENPVTIIAEDVCIDDGGRKAKDIAMWMYKGAWTPVQSIPVADRTTLFTHKISKDWQTPHPLESPDKP
jgi:hypothetical protein